MDNVEALTRLALNPYTGILFDIYSFGERYRSFEQT